MFNFSFTPASPYIADSRRTRCTSHSGKPKRRGKRPIVAYRALFSAHLNEAGLDDIRLALNQNQPLGNSRFHAQIERKTGERREPRPRGRPRLESKSELPVPLLPGQAKLGLWNK